MEERVVVVVGGRSDDGTCTCICSGRICGGSFRRRRRLGGCFWISLLGPWLRGWLVTAMTQFASHGMLLL